jgi:hypothetical protein
MPARLSRLLLAATLLVPVAAATPGHAAGGGAPCDVVDFSPGFLTDHTAICAHQSVTYKPNPVLELSTYALGPIEVYVTKDSGRTWHKQAATGMPYDATSDTGETLNTVQFSPDYTRDRIVYAYVGGYGLYASTDLGASWQRIDPLLLGPGPVNHDALTPFTATAPNPDGGGGAPGGYAYAYGAGITLSGQPAPINSLLVPPAQSQVQGGPGLTEHFLMPPTWPSESAFAVTFTGGDSRVGLYRCDSLLRCQTRVFDAGHGTIARAWLALDYVTSHTLYVVAHQDNRRGTVMYRSTDGGAHFAVWQPVQRLLAASYDTVNLGLELAHPHSLWLRVTDAREVERLYVSADGGAHWTRRTGRLPYDRLWGWGYQRGGLWRRGARLFTLAAHQAGAGRYGPRYDYAGIYCSFDEGRTWQRGCAR